MATFPIFAFAFPLLCAYFKKSGIVGQAVSVGLLLLGRGAFDATGHLLARRLGADIAPIFVFYAAYGYEMTVSIMLSDARHWAIFVHLVGVDVFENLYCVWSVYHEGSAAKNRQLLIIAVLMVRELVEFIVPCGYVILLATTYYIRPEYNALASALDAESFKQRVCTSAAHATLECVVGVLTLALLWVQGHTPVKMLCGIVRTHFSIFLASAVCLQLYMMTLQHSHMGNDLTFDFIWVFNPDAKWQHGVTWTFGG